MSNHRGTNSDVTYEELLDFTKRKGGVIAAGIHSLYMRRDEEIDPLVGAPNHWGQDNLDLAYDMLHFAMDLLNPLVEELYGMAVDKLLMTEDNEYPDKEVIDEVRLETGKIILDFIQSDDNPVRSLDELQTIMEWNGYGFDFRIFRDGTKFIPIDLEEVVEEASEARNS